MMNEVRLLLKNQLLALFGFNKIRHTGDPGEKRKLIPIPGSPPDLIAPPPGCPFVARCPYAMNICNSTLPEMTQLSDTHCARCRLLDEGAPRVVWEGNRE